MENKVSKYLLYAIGEIVLVIIGILIALQINNLNEAKKKENKIISILKEVQNDLELDLLKSDELLDYYYSKDTLINLIRSDKFTYEDYKNDSRLYQSTIFNAFHMKIHTNGYVNLMRNSDNIPDDLKEIINPLNEIYINNKYEIDKFDKRIDLITDRGIDQLASNTGWFYKKDEISVNDQINYFLKDSLYKNAARVYQNAGNNLRTQVQVFRTNAINAYKHISVLTKSSDILPDGTFYNEKAE